MKLIGEKQLEAYRVKRATPKCPALDRYFSSGLFDPATGLGAHDPSILFLRDEVVVRTKHIFEISS